jgi:predicted RND superfamily exporter protein
MKTRMILLVGTLFALLSASHSATAELMGRSEHDSYVVIMRADPVVAYSGEMRSYQATRPGKGRKVDPDSAHVRKYQRFLRDSHDAVLRGAGVARGQKTHEYTVALNGFAANSCECLGLGEDPLVTYDPVTGTVTPVIATTSPDLAFISIPSGSWPILLTTLLLFWYSRCIAGTLVPVFTSIVAVFWQLGALRLLGYGLDPYSVLVPFLVFAIGISHGVQLVNAMAVEAAKGFDPNTAARLAFRALYIPGMLALISDAFGFLTLLFIEIDVIRDLAVAAGLGVAIVIVTNLVLHPLIMSYIGITKGGIRNVQNHGEKQDRKWKLMSHFAHPGVAPISLLIAAIGLGVGLYYKQDLKVGDLDQGAPELRADSRYNLDNKFIIDNYSTSADVLVVMVKTEEEQCTQYNVLRAMDSLQWELQNTPGVQSSASLADVSKIVTKALNEGNWKWYEISRNQTIINASIREAPAGLINTNCDLTPVLVFLEDHKAETLETVTERVEEFASNNNSDEFTFLLAAGNAGVEAATNDVISSAKNMMLIFVYGVVATLCLLTFRSVRAVLCILIPLGLTSVLAEAIMAVSGIGIKVATLPVIALGVGIGVDYGIYIYTKLEKFLLEGRTLQDAYFETLRSTGKAVIFTGVTLGLGVVTWIFSPIKFQADMGFLLFFMFIWNMIGSIWLLPALARFLLRPDQMVARARSKK